MSPKTTNTIARIATLIAGLGLVAMTWSVAQPAKASTESELRTQIASLEQQIAILQAQLYTALTEDGSCTFTRDLTVGMSGQDVRCLQYYLIGEQTFDSATPASGYFGQVTKAAVILWQIQNGLSGTGYFGPLSRAKYYAQNAGSEGQVLLR